MNNVPLRALNLTGRVLVTADFLNGSSAPGFDDHVADPGFDRQIDVSALGVILSRAMKDSRFSAAPEQSDAWLAPRVHAALRLRRSEAADRRIWMWLATVKFPDYVRWRFPGKSGTASKRFLGGDRDNAIARLWWGAELTRDGGDYSAVVRAFARQDIPSTWFVLDAFHNKAAALAAMRMLPNMSARGINDLSSAFNHYLTTVVLDSIAPVEGPDLVAVEDWVNAIPDADDLLKAELPQGPDEDSVDPAYVDAVEALVQRVAEEVGIPLERPSATETSVGE